MRKFALRMFVPVTGISLLLFTMWQGNAQSPGSGLGHPLSGLTSDQLTLFNDGQTEFNGTEEPDEGLGPVFNGTSCGECHIQGALGGAGTDLVVTRETRIGAVVNGVYSDLPEVGGPVLQRRSVAEFGLPCPPEVVPPQAQFVSRRITTPLFGTGLIEAIPDSTILSQADPNDSDGDGISGRANVVFDQETGQTRVGRFGWKARVPTLHFFSGDAYLNEMGITSPTFPAENLPQGLPIPPGADLRPDDPEDALGVDVQKFTDFMRFLAPPPLGPITKAAVRGAVVFASSKCASCHTPVMVTGTNAVAALSQKIVPLFSDLLVHDMGPGLADGIVQEQATGSEFRTAPLWGLRFRQFFLHDGRATTVPDAINAHGGEAQSAQRRFRSLSAQDRSDLLAFLNTI